MPLGLNILIKSCPSKYALGITMVEVLHNKIWLYMTKYFLNVCFVLAAEFPLPS